MGFESLNQIEDSQGLDLIPLPNPSHNDPPSGSKDAQSHPELSVNDVDAYMERIAELEVALDDQREIEKTGNTRAERAERDVQLLNNDCSRLTAENSSITALLHESRQRIEELEKKKSDQDKVLAEEKNAMRADFSERLAMRDSTIVELRKQLENAKTSAPNTTVSSPTLRVASTSSKRRISTS